MNTFTRRLAIAGLFGATALGGFSALTLQSSAQAQTTTTAPSSDAPTPAAAQPKPDCDRGPRGMRGPNLNVAASTIGISVDDLKAALHDGSTVAQVAQAHNVEPQAVIDALVADVQQHLATQVEDGHLTQAQADQKLADAKTHITDFVQNGRPERGGPRPDASNDESAPQS